ncbi:MAG: acetyltransferase [Desulfobacteraceae bacterium]|nr:acetyltransferase [Desulfobacteraceae bacterium]
MRKGTAFWILVFLMVLCTASVAFGRAAKTTYPVVFAHGMLGFDELVGIDYFGNDYGVFVGDPCDEPLEISCNPRIDRGQQAFATAVNPLQSSENRGLALADQVESYMATVGASAVNMVGHSQGGIDARKAAKILAERKGRQVVKVLISISSPHRGSPLAKSILDQGDEAINKLLNILANAVLTPIMFGDKGDIVASMKSLMYDDYDADDGEVTGMKAFNLKYGMDNRYVGHYASVITADQENMNPILQALTALGGGGIDGDGWCGPENEDCDHDGAAGAGNGNFDDVDDDGLVGINSQQMGYRLSFKTSTFLGGSLTVDSSTGYVADINRPDKTQSTSHSSVVKADHLDVLGLGVIPYLKPDPFDEFTFYGAVFDYVAHNEGCRR